jgi:hypothetical protein
MPRLPPVSPLRQSRPGRLALVGALGQPNAEYLVVNDYGTGGIWAVVSAPSKSVLEAAYPELVVFAERPTWMDESEYEAIKSEACFRFDRPPAYWNRYYRAP